MVKVKPPLTDTVVEIDESLVERYTAAGWTPVEESKPKKPASKPASK